MAIWHFRIYLVPTSGFLEVHGVSLCISMSTSLTLSTLSSTKMLSEQEMKWVDEGRVWLTLQAFLQKHEGHALIFDSDVQFPDMQFYERQMFDEL